MNLVTLQPIPWETRNLGMPSFAVSVPAADGPFDASKNATFADSAEAQLRVGIAVVRAAHERFFIQARVEPAHPLVAVLQNLNFHCAETSLVPHCNLARNASLSQYKLNPGLFLPARYEVGSFAAETADKANESLRADICELARRAFTGDRFHMDPKCDNALADARYALWMNDLWAEEAVSVTVFRYREALAGFMARRGNALMLAGFDRAYSHRGWGDYFWLGIMQQLRDEGFTNSHTSISSGNVAVLNLYARLGWKFRNPRLMFHFWGTP